MNGIICINVCVLVSFICYNAIETYVANRGAGIYAKVSISFVGKVGQCKGLLLPMSM